VELHFEMPASLDLACLGRFGPNMGTNGVPVEIQRHQAPFTWKMKCHWMHLIELRVTGLRMNIDNHLKWVCLLWSCIWNAHGFGLFGPMILGQIWSKWGPCWNCETLSPGTVCRDEMWMHLIELRLVLRMNTSLKMSLSCGVVFEMPVNGFGLFGPIWGYKYGSNGVPVGNPEIPPGTLSRWSHRMHLIEPAQDWEWTSTIS
jgi:hypothetical protein